MNNVKYILILLAMAGTFVSNAQPLREYSLVSLMNGESTFISDSGTLFNLPIWGFGIDETSVLTDLPGPTIYANQGDSVHITMTNTSMEGHTIHLHGLDVDEANDGVPHYTGFVQENETFKYRFKATHAGNFMYHCHVTTTMHLALGMYGMVIVHPSDSSNRIYNGGPIYNRQYEYLFSEIDSRWNADYTTIGSFLSYNPDLLLINGRNRSLIYEDSNLVLKGVVGDQLLMRLMNVGYRVNRFVFPNAVKAQIHTSDGRVLDEPIDVDTLIVYPGERYSVLAEVLETNPTYVSVDYLDPYRLKFLGRDYIPINDTSFSYIEPVIIDNDTDTIGVGLKERRLSSLVIFPNPVEDELHLQSELKDFKSCSVTDIQGRQVFSKKLSQRNEVIDVEVLSSGSYFILLELKNGEMIYKKFIKQ